MYLLNTGGVADGSARNQNNRFALAKVHGMNGLLIFPDGYALPSGYDSDGGTGMSKVNDIIAGFPSDSIPADTWTSMQDAGAVFLPSAGTRGGSSGNTYISDVGNIGHYWSASSDDIKNAYELHFKKESVNPSYSNMRRRDCSVRLVTEVKK